MTCTMSSCIKPPFIAKSESNPIIEVDKNILDVYLSLYNPNYNE